MSMDVVIGIDLGTQGVRTMAVTNNGHILASAHEKLTVSTQALPTGWAEQDANDWWQATRLCLRQLVAQLPAQTHVSGIAIDSTSGTILPVDAQGNSLHAALMYNDARSQPYVPAVRQAAADLEQRLGYAFNASFALPKILWLMHERPKIDSRTHLYIHAADFLAGRLTGDYGVTDYSNALKTGYDLLTGEWPAFIERELGLPLNRLPRVAPPGQHIGALTPEASADTGLPVGTPVFGGATDGTAAQIASGAVEPGAWNSSLGTTLVVKGITTQLLQDPQHRIYSHRHPSGWWMPGGASNTGCEWIMREYAGQDLHKLDTLATSLLPTRCVRYPLARTGERFPFLNARATGFVAQHPTLATSSGDALLLYAAGLEGTALLERLCYDTLREIGAEVSERLHVTGGGSKSEVWLRIRASALGRQLVRPSSSETAMGAVLLAASGAWFHTLGQAAQALVKPDITVDPDPALSPVYDEMYAEFCAQLRQRGYIEPPTG
jgi:xylulokinase